MDNFKGTNGKTYTMSPLSVGDIVAFRRWVQWRPYTDFQKLKETIDEDDYKSGLADLRKECAARKLYDNSPEVEGAVETMEGITKLISLSLQKNHPTITPDEVAENIKVDDIREIGANLLIISDLVKTDKATAQKKRSSKT